MEYRLSDHAARRAVQRNLSEDEIDFLLEHGQLVHNTGVIFCRLRHKDIPSELPRNSRYRRLVGSTAILCRCGYYVVTVYREQQAFKMDDSKTAYSQRGERLTNCPYCNPADFIQ